MSLIEAEHALESALSGGRVRRKVNNTGNLRSRAGRVARGSPEVMVKITGFGRGGDHIRAHLGYITRNGRLELETDRGDILRDREAVRDLLGQWSDDIDSSPRHKNQRDTMHLVLSMPEGTPETAVRNAARAYAKRTFGANHEYVFVLHTDEPHPHVHLTVRISGFDGRRLNPRKADLQAWREAFAREMRDQGIDTEATPRSVRGVVRKAEKGVVRHIERGDARRGPRGPRVKTARIREVAEELLAEVDGRPVAGRPWEARIRQRQQFVRNAWLNAAMALDNTVHFHTEQRNARPEYDRLDPARVRAGQRAAAVYQSGPQGPRFRIPAAALARMRDMSRLDVVQHQRPAQVLLHAHAPDGVGRDGGADHDVRWPRACATAVAAGTEGDRRRAGRLTGHTLAATIRRFVQTMPPIDTERHELRRRLIGEFGPDRGRGNLPAAAHDVSTSSPMIRSLPKDREPG